MSRPSHAVSHFAARALVLSGRILVLACMVSAIVSRAAAQANIPVFRGDVGLLAGTQAPPGIYAGLFYNYYHAGRLLDRDFVPDSISTTTNAAALTFQYSSAWKILGARYAAMVTVPWSNSAIETLDRDTSSAWGFSDLYVLPLQLGWTFAQGEVLIGQGFFAPTGRFDPSGFGNSGFGVWSWESSFGFTVYKDTTRKVHFSTLASYQVQSDKRDTDRKPGNVLTLEGGLGARFRKINGRAGAVYYAQWKVSDDKNFPLPPRFDARNRTFGIGPEITFALIGQPVIANFTLRYYREMWSRVAPQGGTLFLLGSAYLPPKSSRPKRMPP